MPKRAASRSSARAAERRRRLAEREARVAAALDQQHPLAGIAHGAREDGSRAAGADDGEVEVAEVTRGHWQRSQATGGSTVPERFMPLGRVRRAARHDGQSSSRSRSQASTRDDTAADLQAAAKGLFDDRTRRRREVAGRRERCMHAQSPRTGISATCSTPCAKAHAVERAAHSALVGGHERRADEDEGANADAGRQQPVASAGRSGRASFLSEARKRLRVDGLETHRHLQATGEPAGETAPRARRRAGVAFDDHLRERRDQRGERPLVLDGHGARVEEVARVVQLDLRAARNLAGSLSAALELHRQRARAASARRGSVATGRRRRTETGTRRRRGRR
jgi:hypothetical protein